MTRLVSKIQEQKEGLGDSHIMEWKVYTAAWDMDRFLRHIAE